LFKPARMGILYLLYQIFIFPIALLVSVIRWYFRKKPNLNAGKKRVAVIGGGIAGSGAAWALNRDGFDVVLFEERDKLGGNAKTHTWDYPDKPITGLSVLAWPEKYFHNYNRLLQELGIETTEVQLPFFIQSEKELFAHGMDPSGQTKLDMPKWVKMIEFIRKVNHFFAGKSHSVYNMSFVNPMNVIPLKWLAQFYGISNDFWDNVIVPIYSSTFLTIQLDYLPCVVTPLISDIIPLHEMPKLTTWKNHSAEVFDAMARGLKVRTSSPVEKIIRRGGKHVVHVKGQGIEEEPFDFVVFASPSCAVAKMINSPSWLEEILLSRVLYCDHTDISFTDGTIHGDKSVLPVQYQDVLLSDYANYIEVRGSGKTYEVENTFLLSSWVPAVQKKKAERPMMITYNNKKNISNPVGHVSNIGAHPHLSVPNLIISSLLRFVQGHQGRYYCASYTTPGNGHELSFLSGLAVAQAIGAKYPFPKEVDCVTDFNKLSALMGF